MYLYSVFRMRTGAIAGGRNLPSEPVRAVRPPLALEALRPEPVISSVPLRCRTRAELRCLRCRHATNDAAIRELGVHRRPCTEALPEPQLRGERVGAATDGARGQIRFVTRVSVREGSSLLIMGNGSMCVVK